RRPASNRYAAPCRRSGISRTPSPTCPCRCDASANRGPRRRSPATSPRRSTTCSARQPSPQTGSRPTRSPHSWSARESGAPFLESLRATLDAERSALPEDERLHVVALLNDVEVAVWMVHRLAKILNTLVEPPR